MKIGKVPNDLLKELILNKIKTVRPEVLVRPAIGEDCAVIDFGDDVCVLSSDPISGAVNDVGRLAVHISCNDIASTGVAPIGMMVTIMAPPLTTGKDLEIVMEQITEEAARLNVDIIGGHTEITDAVNRLVIVSTTIGRVSKNKLVKTSGAKAGDYVIMTKSAGIEGTAILAKDKEEILSQNLDTGLIKSAQSFINRISVVKEGIIAGEFGVTSMHDVTEGGVLGAVWEIAEASGNGVTIYKNKIPVEKETMEITKFFNIDPLKLISSGSMIITCRNGDDLVKKLEEQGVAAAVIGVITGEKERILISENGNELLRQPEEDELYKAI